MSKVAYRLTPARLSDVVIDSSFWSPRQETNRVATLPAQYKMCKETGRIDAYRLDWKEGDAKKPHLYWDSDIAKWLEAASYSLATHKDPELDKLLDEVIALLVSAQRSDGYLNAHYNTVENEKRWSNVRDCHELYCAGHLMEAAAAHFEATGKRTLLDAMCRYADHIDATFGPEEGKKHGYCGHPEVELALVKLARASGQDKYLKLAKYFVDERGNPNPHFYNEEAAARGDKPMAISIYAYSQSHKPLREQSQVVGHAVRGLYVYSGMADVAGLTGDAALLAACKRLWADAVTHKMYVTGAVGPSAHNEGFTKEYDLPNESAYAETCANIALGFFAHRLLHIEADGQYADVLERVLYNSTISGVSLEGTRFFYTNPLAFIPIQPDKDTTVRGSGHGQGRQDWFNCACCPPNIARLLASLGSYVYSSSPTSAYVHLYIGGKGKLRVGNREVTIEQKTEYPWDGDIDLTISTDQGDAKKPAKFDLMLRIPGWCRSYQVRINGKKTTGKVIKGYLKISRAWKSGDKVSLSLSMPVERIAANPAVLEDLGKVALQRGPVVYCLEQNDNKAPVRQIALPDKAALKAKFDRKLLGGVTVIEGPAVYFDSGPWKGKGLYQRADSIRRLGTRIRAIPYASWNNRGNQAMTVWMPRG